MMSVYPVDLDTDVASWLGAGPGVRATPSTTVDTFLTADGPAFAGGLSLSTWPERAPVGGAVRHTIEGGSVIFTFVPSSPLEDRWYAVQLDVTDIGSRFSTRAPSPEPAAASGTLERRFFPGSNPLLRVAIFGADEIESRTIELAGSESLRGLDNAALGALVTVSTSDGTVVPCAVLADPEFDTQGYAWLRCARVDLHAPITVHVRPGLFAVSGLPVRDATGATDMHFTWTPAMDGISAPYRAADPVFSIPPGH